MSSILELMALQNGGIDKMFSNMSKDGIRMLLDSAEMKSRAVANDPIALAVFERGQHWVGSHEQVEAKERHDEAVKQWNEVELPKLKAEHARMNEQRIARGDGPLPDPGFETYEQRTGREKVAQEARSTMLLAEHNQRMKDFMHEQNAERTKRGEAPLEWKDLTPADVQPSQSDNGGQQ